MATTETIKARNHEYANNDTDMTDPKQILATLAVAAIAVRQQRSHGRNPSPSIEQ